MLNKRAFATMAIVSLATILLASSFLVAANPIQSGEAAKKQPTPPPPPPVPRSGPPVPILDVPVAVSGNNLYMAWPNNDTGHWNVFFGKSTDGGKTLKTMMISAPNKGNTIDQNTQISASGSNVYVTWWTNKTGTLMPVFRASNDNGDTFAKAITLNRTG